LKHTQTGLFAYPCISRFSQGRVEYVSIWRLQGHNGLKPSS
jgi:hypothetical protein